MRFSATLIAAAFVYQGCKSDESVSTDAVIEELNDGFGASWTEEQKKKYSELAAMKSEECQAKVTPGLEAILKSTDLQAKLKAEAKVQIEAMKNLTAEKRAEAAKTMATGVCEKLARYKAAADKPQTAPQAAPAGGAPKAASAPKSK